METRKRLDLQMIVQRLTGRRGKSYWRSLEELADTEDFQEYVHREFPAQASAWNGAFNRRDFLQLMAASLALGGLSSCVKQPDEKIVPYVRQPEGIVPGKALSFATAMVLGGYASGVLVTSSMGRPTKIEGNPGHPASLGATNIFMHASLLTMYDPERSQVVAHRNEISTWDSFLKALEGKGPNIRILTGTVTSPTLGDQLQALLKQYPRARWHQYEPVNDDALNSGAVMAFGEGVHTRYDFSKADVILSLDSNFLVDTPGSVRYARDYADRKRIHEDSVRMNRLYAVETTPTITGAAAEHVLRLHADQIELVAQALASALNIPGASAARPAVDPRHTVWLETVLRDLERHRGSSIVLAGRYQPPRVHALVHAINHALGNTNNTVIYSDHVEVQPVVQWDSLRDLVHDMEAGAVDLLVILGGNPVYDAPPELDFGSLLPRVPMTVHVGLYEDETAALCDWHVPETHYLESWSDARAFDGTATIIQPLIAPLYDGKSAHEILEELMGHSGRKGYDVVKGYWKSRHTGGDFETFWKQCLNDGVIPGTALPPKEVNLASGELSTLLAGQEGAVKVEQGMEIIFRPDPTLWDGKFANNGWLQELPKPLTKLTWDNAALVSPAAALRLGVTNEDVVELRYQGRTLESPILVLPGHPDDSVTLYLGHGRTRSGKVGTGTGCNAYALRTGSTPWFGRGLELRKTGRRYPLAITQEHQNMEGRDQVRTASISDFLRNPLFAKQLDPAPSADQTLYPKHEYNGYAWGMSIDLSSCIGCNACVIACQAENNIPIVGKEQVQDSREMHWIRVDTYFDGDLHAPDVSFQPVPCMHCENAPCELVCPVGATVHDSEGLNVMVYNRCIGTRYCSNNCPYKVRRFNFLQYVDNDSATLKMMRNPEVTVRSRGVMEKCTYCVQRIDAARIGAEEENRPIRDGEVVTACQSACPTRAIVFGDINNKESAVAKLKARPDDYALLAELNTKPRTTYLAKITNPNPEMHDGTG